MNISGPAAVAKPEMLFYAPGDLTVTKVCSDLNIGLPAEIEARQKQYEYYRDKLLTFAEGSGTILSRAEQSRAEQSRAEQSRAEQSRAEQSTD